MSNIIYDINTEELQPIISVNCSGRDLDQLPTNLPAYTKILILKENNIEDLTPLLTNVAYKTVQDLYLDNNRVKSIEELEGSYWLRNFRVLSLSGNELSQVPIWITQNSQSIFDFSKEELRAILK